MKGLNHLILLVALGSGIGVMRMPAVSQAAPNTGSGPQKTEKQCKDERTACLRGCDQLIDIDNNIQRCKDRCTDAYIICTPARQNPGGSLRPPMYPGKNAPILRRGVEGETAPSGTESTTPQPESK
mgnify:CR=1 FL=1